MAVRVLDSAVVDLGHYPSSWTPTDHSIFDLEGSVAVQGLKEGLDSGKLKVLVAKTADASAAFESERLSE